MAPLADRPGGGAGRSGPGQVRGLPSRHPQRQGRGRRPCRAVELGRRLVLGPGRPRLPRGGPEGLRFFPLLPVTAECHPPRHVPARRRRHRHHRQRLRPGRQPSSSTCWPDRSSATPAWPGRPSGCSTWCRRPLSWSWGTPDPRPDPAGRVVLLSSCVGSAGCGPPGWGILAGTARPLGCFLLVPALCEGLRGIRATGWGERWSRLVAVRGPGGRAADLSQLDQRRVRQFHQAADPPDRPHPARRPHRSGGHAVPRRRQPARGPPRGHRPPPALGGGQRR